MLGGLTLITFGLVTDVASFVVTSSTASLVVGTVVGFTTDDAPGGIELIVDADEQPASKAASRKIDNTFLIFHLHYKGVESKTLVWKKSSSPIHFKTY